MYIKIIITRIGLTSVSPTFRIKKNKIYKKHRLDKQNIELKNSYLSISKEFEILNTFLRRSYLISVETNVKNN